MKQWPILDEALKNGSFAYIDFVFARRALAHMQAPPEEALAAPLAVVFALFRQGHLALEETPTGIEWALQSLCIQNRSLFTTLLLEGLNNLPPCPYLVRSFPYLRLYSSAQFESEITLHLNRLNAASPSLEVGLPLLDPRLNAQQQQAVHTGIAHALSFLAGGPGTGKTFTAAHLVKACCGTATLNVIVAAPTGKAAFHLEAQLKRALESSDVHIHAATLHSLLKLGRRQEESPPLCADLIVIDESSMIDVKMLARLLAAVPTGARLVLIGDPHQLPPVEAGSLFADLVESNRYPTTQLTQSLRSERQGLLAFAEAIKQGDSRAALACFHSHNDIERLESGEASPSELLALLWRRFGPCFTALFKEEPTAETLLGSMNSLALLSCLRQGPLGVDAVNHYFFTQQRLCVQDETWMALPLMMTSNDYALELYNGDQGVLLCKTSSRPLAREFCLGDKALFRTPTGEIRTLCALSLSGFTLSYCLSVHKSQGSEYDEVLVLAPPGSDIFGREVLYTAVTRAKKKVTLVTTDELFSRAVHTSSRKRSSCKDW